MLRKIYRKIKINKQLKGLEVGKNFQWNLGVITDKKNISIGENVYIGPQARLHGKGGIKIGNNVIIAPRLTIHSSNHNYKLPTHLPYDGKTILKMVVIEDNVWIGDNVMIAPGVKVGEGSIIGMGSVVTKDIKSMSVVGGNPARIIKERENLGNYFKLKREKKSYLGAKIKGEINYEEQREI